MGIKILNRYLLNNCSYKSIHHSKIELIRDRVIVVDVSIYLYKYIGDDTLESSLKRLISLFLKNSITLIFIFDGKPPIEKRELLIRRRIDKEAAELKYNEAKYMVSNPDTSTEKDLVEKEKELAILKRQFVRITHAHIQTAKKIMDSFNVSYIDAPGEADTLCAYMVHTKVAWGCLSDDMDMLVYGCNYVLRNINLSRETVMIYDMENILKDTHMSMKTFREITVISGTDYSCNNKTSLPKTLKLLEKYKIQLNNNNTEMMFYDWLEKNTKYIENRCRLANVYSMFEMSNYPELSECIDNYVLNSGLRQLVILTNQII